MGRNRRNRNTEEDVNLEENTEVVEIEETEPEEIQKVEVKKEPEINPLLERSNPVEFMTAVKVLPLLTEADITYIKKRVQSDKFNIVLGLVNSAADPKLGEIVSYIDHLASGLEIVENGPLPREKAILFTS